MNGQFDPGRIALSLLGAAVVSEPARSAILRAQAQQAHRRAFKVLCRTAHVDTNETTAASLVFVAPDRYHATDLDGRLRMQTVRIGNQGWMKTGSGPWEPELMDSSGMLKRLRGPTPIDAPGYEVKSATAVGPRDAGGRKAQVYDYTVVGRGETAEVRVWVADDSGLPIRYEDSFANEYAKLKHVWEIDYDDALSVQPPSTR